MATKKTAAADPMVTETTAPPAKHKAAAEKASVAVAAPVKPKPTSRSKDAVAVREAAVKSRKAAKSRQLAAQATDLGQRAGEVAALDGSNAPTGIEEAALARLNKTLPADGSPAQLLLELQAAGEALLDFEQLDEDQKRTIATLSGRLLGGYVISDEDHKTMVGLHEEVIDLQGQLRDEQAARAKAEGRVDEFRTEIERKADRITQLTSERDEFHRKASSLEFELSREKSSNRQLNAKLLAVFNRGIVARLFNRAS